MHDEARNGRPSLVQADDFNKEDHVYRILGQTRCPLGRIFPQGTTINSAVYCETLKKMRRAIQNKRLLNAECHHSFASR